MLAARQPRGQCLWRPQPRLRLRADGNLYQGGGIGSSPAGRGHADGATDFLEERSRLMSIVGSPPDFDLSLSSTLARNWTVVAAPGVFGLIIGLIAFLFPGPTLLSLVGLFAVFLIIDGMLAIFVGLLAAWIFIRSGDSLSQPSSVQQSYITPRLSDRHSLTFVEHGKISDILFAILPHRKRGSF